MVRPFLLPIFAAVVTSPNLLNLYPQPGAIGLFDSGIGGLSVASAVAELLPEEDLLYVSDNAHAPYGPQAPEAILDYSRRITESLLQAGCKLIVVACNTATSLAIDQLRAEHPDVPFVGLEPAVKPAAREERVGVLATQATLNSARYQQLKAKYLHGRPVLEDACVGSVPLIESEVSGSPALRAKLHEILDPMLAVGVTALVLGCTHYPMIKADIAAVCGLEVALIDPAPAAARQVGRVVAEIGAASVDNLTPVYDFYATGDGRALRRALMGLPFLNKRQRLLTPASG